MSLVTGDSEQQVLELFVRNQTRIKGFISSLMGDFAAVPVAQRPAAWSIRKQQN
ncbi:MAG: hypothetical protein NTW21_37450 [Verrucomicrobia bacterium]|nr:hypothetical protein [Verrucomicrobiota bacterium]